MQNKLILKIFLSIFSLIITILFIEFSLRYYRIGDDERNLLYQHDKDLGWFPKPNLSYDFTGAFKININHNSLGFRDNEFIDNPGFKNLVFIGDSFAYGYDSEIHNRFSELVAKSITNYDIFNLGVSGYSTDQEYLLLKKYSKSLNPDTVYLLYHHNDWHGNSVNHIYYGYHKPYFNLDEETNNLILKGVPVPKSVNHLKHEFPIIYKSKIAIWLTNIFYSNKISEIKCNPQITFNILLRLKQYVEKNLNAEFKIGIVGNGNTPGLNNFLEYNEFDFIHIDKNKSKEYYTATGHWTISGNKKASEKIVSHLKSTKSF